MLRGLSRVGAQVRLTMAADNLARLPRLLAAGAAGDEPRLSPGAGPDDQNASARRLTIPTGGFSATCSSRGTASTI
jgi:hypothetical protein